MIDTRFCISVFLVGLCILVTQNVAVLAEVESANEATVEIDPAGIENAAREVLSDHCFRCHGSEKTSGKLDLRSIESMLAGGLRGPAIVPGNASESHLVQFTRPGAKPHMPPGKQQLEDQQIEALAAWVDQLSPELIAQPTKEVEETPHETSSSSPAMIPEGIDPTLAIDFMVAKRWQERNVEPSSPTDDATFARRLYLDLTGRIPTLEQLNKFLADTNSDKRDRLIDQLLESELHARHLADTFDVVLLGRGDDGKLNERTQHGWREYLESSFASNRPWNQMAREMVLARATDSTDVRAGWYLYERKNDFQAIAESVSPSFFGLRIECAQCHDHPLAAEIEQRHYWGLVAFFNRGKNDGAKNGPRVVESAIGGFNKYTDLAGDAHDALLTYFASATIHEEIPGEETEVKDDDSNYFNGQEGAPAGEPRVPRFSRRQQFADEVLSDHPLLARSFVNRAWALMLGRGIVHPVDQMDSMHAASHPELLEWLANDFRNNDYDIRRLLRSLARTRAYQLESASIGEGQLPEDFAHALHKPLIAESYLNSILVALDQNESDNSEIMTLFRSEFPDVFPEEPTATLSQALLLTNSPKFFALFDAERPGIMTRLRETEDVEQQVRHAFMAIFGRQPDDDEFEQTVDYLKARQGNPEALGQMLWAMITSSEFRVNH